MDEEKLKIKIAYLQQENAQLREALLDTQIKHGVIGFKDDTKE